MWRGGGYYKRSAALERVWESIHVECGHTVEHQVYVPGWDRWRWTCPCGARGVTLAEPTGPCGSCGGDLGVHREEAILDLEVRSAEVPREYFDVTVRYPVPTDRQRLTAAADHDGAVNKEAEREKRARYPDGRTPYRATPLALETGGRHGRAALLHLRKLARARAASLEEDGDAAASALMQRWGARLSVALHQRNTALLRSATGSEKKTGGRELTYVLAG